MVKLLVYVFLFLGNSNGTVFFAVAEINYFTLLYSKYAQKKHVKCCCIVWWINTLTNVSQKTNYSK